MILEICTDSYQSTVNAERGGASRIELCSCLDVGGLTPTIGLLKHVKDSVKIPVHVLIRPRAGDFLYSEDELAVMTKDIRACKEAGADGIVIGALTSEGLIDEDVMKTLLSACQPLPVTFHRGKLRDSDNAVLDICSNVISIDMCLDVMQAIETLARLGCKRILSSGQHASAAEGSSVLKKMADKANGRLSIIAGGGITSDNLPQIVEEAGCDEYHASARSSVQSLMAFQNPNVSMGRTGEEFSQLVCDSGKVRALSDILRKCQ